MVRSAIFLIWVVDSLVKVFPGTLPPAAPQQTIRIECARNEWESGQLVFRADVPVRRLEATVSPLRQAGGAGVIDAGHLRARFLGLTQIKQNTLNTPPAELCAIAPAAIPDLLREDAWTSVPANFSQPVWITVNVPRGIPAGLYKGTVTLTADGASRSLPLELTVFNFDLPDQRHLLVTNWIHDDYLARYHHVARNSEDYFKILAAYARDMSEHRQNVFWVGWRLIDVTRENDGHLTFDYALFDRYIQTFFDNGMFDRIEIQFVARFEKDWSSQNIILLDVNARDRASGRRLALPPEQGLGPLLEDLERHLYQKGWLERSMIHVCDEASMRNIESYRRASAFVHQHAPRLRRIDAIETVHYQDALEVWVPKISHLNDWYPWFQEAQRQGNEMWFYICLQPRGAYMNRFMDLPLIKTRLLHWLNYGYSLPGYLHWGLNCWNPDPYGLQGQDNEHPPGDTHVIYPGKNGPLSSIRWEAERDGIEDFEYFTLLEARLRQAAAGLGAAAKTIDSAARPMELYHRMVTSFTVYKTDVEEFRSVRRTMAHEIEQAAAEPPLLWQTLPDENKPRVPDPPSTIVVRGITRPGAKVTLGGKPVAVAPDGTFLTDTDTNRVVLETTLSSGTLALAKRQTRTITTK